MSIVERERVETEVAPVTAKDVLHRTADLLEEFGWVQCSFGQDALGNEVSPTSPHVDRFCVLGAMGRACVDLGLDYGDREGFYGKNPPSGHWMAFNDAKGRTKAEVVSELRARAA